MKLKLLLFIVLLTAINLASCTRTARIEAPPQDRFARLGIEQPVDTDEIRLVDAVTFLRQGETGSVTIIGRPGVRYNIAATYRSGDRVITARNEKTADADGKVTWTWDVASDTSPGTYPLVISGGGKTITTQYTVANNILTKNTP